mmetsp:Transcript_51163/g.122542  ORF Transcript_51163/g.122542 Transcript_51163/m.122542 type:complete len:290 (+) Transcript_51163:99-968(+)
MQPQFELTIGNLLPPATLLTLVCGVWSIYFFLHVLPLLQLTLPASHFSPEVAFRGWVHCIAGLALTTMMLICFFRAALTMPGQVPEGEEWRFGTFKDPNAIREVKFSGERRRCKHCLIYKPDRCHHCRICHCCILKMDHHCPWIMNCVGFRNHKYFFLLVIYSILSCGFIALTITETIVQSLEQELPLSHRFLLMQCFTTASIMGALLTIFAGFHVMLMLRGLTTIEFCEKMSIVANNSKSSKYDLGLYRNVTAVVGPRPWLWLLPLDPPVGDGLQFDLTAPGQDPEWT